MPLLPNASTCAARLAFEARAKPDLGLTVADLRDLADQAPPGARELVDTIGIESAVALMRALGGTEVAVPKRPDNNRAGARSWEYLAEFVGEAAMPRLAERYGGSFLAVPICTRLLAEKRAAWMRKRFDELTHSKGPALSAREAVRIIGTELSVAGKPLSHRSIERIIN